MSRVSIGHNTMAECIISSWQTDLSCFGLLLPAQAASMHTGWFEFSCSLATVLDFIGYPISNEHALICAADLLLEASLRRVGLGRVV